MKTIDEMDYNELVDYISGEILTGLIAGKLRSTVFICLQQAIRWKECQ